MLPQACRFQDYLTLGTNPFESNTESESDTGSKVSALCVMGHSGQPLHDMALQTTFPEVVGAGVGAEGGSGEMELDGKEQPTSTATPVTPTSAAYLKMLENSLMWGNLCPTAPDSLPCYPFQEQDPDPFLLKSLSDTPPDIVFAGNMVCTV